MPGKNKEKSGQNNVFTQFLFKILLYILTAVIFIGDLLFNLVLYLYKVLESIALAVIDGVIAIILSIRRFVGRISRVFSKVGGIVRSSTVEVQRTVVPHSLKVKYFLLGLFVALAIVFIEQGYSFLVSLPHPRLIGNVNYSVSTQIYDRNGNLLYDVYRDQDRTPIDIDTVPDHVIQATLAIEDKDFYKHNGISPVGGILRAIKDMTITGELQGGSTITQQLVKASLLTPERTFERKFREAILALWAEQIFTKKEILGMYLNQVPYGGSAYGIEEASQTYFSKPAVDLTVDEAALLAGMTQAPSRYSPFLNPELAIHRRNEVLRNMLELGYLSQEEYVANLQMPIDVDPPKTFIRAPHFVFFVKAYLEERYGIRRVEEGGLRVVTTLDVELQDEIEDILAEELDKVQRLNVGNGAALVTSPQTGEILAMVGSRNYFSEPYGAFNVTTARRQPGSSIKPVMYSLALEQQYTAASVINDAPVVFNSPGAPPYKPVNYDNRFHGPVSLRYALANSYNVPAVKVLNTLGVDNFIDHSERLGITTWDTPERYGLSLTLGGAEVKMTDMAVAFGTFANYGEKVQLNPLISVEDFRGNTLETFSVNNHGRVLSQETSFIISDILSDNFARQFAFGPQSDLNIPGYKVAVKTGTTNDLKDNWTIGYNRKFLTAVWVGNNDNTPMSQVASGVTGASPIWNRVMQTVIQRNIPVTADVQPPTEFSIPQGIVSKDCFFGKIEYFKAGTEQGACQGALFKTTATPEPTPGPRQ